MCAVSALLLCMLFASLVQSLKTSQCLENQVPRHSLSVQNLFSFISVSKTILVQLSEATNGWMVMS